MNGSINEEKIILATRIKSDSYEDCVEAIKKYFNGNFHRIAKIFVLCDLNKENFKIEGVPVEIIFDKNPIKACAFNSVLSRLCTENAARYHLLTFSKEVNLKNENIERMINEINQDCENIIVAGYRLKDDVLKKEEANIYAGGDLQGEDVGIAYKIPWNTCALWNKKFVYGSGKERLQFDKICESENNQFEGLYVKVMGSFQVKTQYEGMEDGLAIAKLVNDNPTLNLKCKLIKEPLDWIIEENDARRLNHRLKMARKNIVLSTFINIKGYSMERFKKAIILV
jgi:hypothetical protein